MPNYGSDLLLFCAPRWLLAVYTLPCHWQASLGTPTETAQDAFACKIDGAAPASAEFAHCFEQVLLNTFRIFLTLAEFGRRCAQAQPHRRTG